jgi:hypothetical protein
MINQRRDLLILTKINGKHRPVPPDHRTQRGDLRIPVPVTPGQAATVSHERPPACPGI